MTGTMLSDHKPNMLDIRSNAAHTIEPEDILLALQAPVKSIPSLALWNTCGLKLFTKITKSPHYYLTNTESRLLESSAGDIAAHIPSGTRIIELGAGYVGHRYSAICMNASLSSSAQLRHLQRLEQDRTYPSSVRASAKSRGLRGA